MRKEDHREKAETQQAILQGGNGNPVSIALAIGGENQEECGRVLPSLR